MNFKHTMHLIFTGILAVLLSGCLETNDHYILNPDGSGKLLHDAKVVMVDINIGGREKTAEEKAQMTVQRLISESEGIDAWKDLSYEVLADGRVAVRGTAYFPDLNQLVLKHGGNSFDLLVPLYRTEEGNGILEFEWSEGEASETDQANSEVVVDSGRLATERSKYQQAKPMLAAMFGNLKLKQKYTLPAAVSSSVNLKQEGSAVELQLMGTELIEVLDELIGDDAWLASQLKAGKTMDEGFALDGSLNEKLFGSAGGVSATTTGVGEVQFDYASEMEAAREAMPDMLEALGFNLPGVQTAMMPPAAGEGFKSLLVGGVRLVRDVGNDEVRPFNWNPGLSVSLTGTFAGSVLEVTDGEITRAESLEGESLLSDSEFDRDIGFPNLSEDGTTVTFELDLKLPEKSSRGVKLLSGTLEYQTSASTMEIDLGLSSLATGTKSKELGAVIGEYSKEEWGGETRYMMTLDLQVPVGQIKEVRFFDAGGKQLTKVNPAGYSGFNDAVSMNFSSEAPFPDQGNIIVILHDGLQKYQIPFSVGPFDWLGLPVVE
ncbi:MAG: hypothetical protein AAF571_03615 [Verrucomicrobiota bacterium]